MKEMRRLLLLALLLSPSLALADFIHYYPPASGGAATYPLNGGGTGCVTPAFSFTADTGAGICLAAANNVQVQVSDQGPTGMGIFTATQGSFGFYDALNNWTGWLNTDGLTEIKVDGTSILKMNNALGVGLIAANGSTAAAARTLTSPLGTIVIGNPAGVAGNPTLDIDTTQYASSVRARGSSAEPVP